MIASNMYFVGVLVKTEESEITAASDKIDKIIDASDLTCPLPLLKAKQGLNKLVSGQVLTLICTDPGSVRDFKVFCEQSGNLLLESKEEGGTYSYRLQKN